MYQSFGNMGSHDDVFKGKVMKKLGIRVFVLGLLLLGALGKPKVTLGQAQTGTLMGTVTLRSSTGGIQLGASGGNPYQRRSRHASTGSEEQTADILIWLTSDKPPQVDRREKPIHLDQKDQAFVPQLLPVLVGETVRIQNSDPVYHNVFSLSKIKRFDVGRRPQGDYKDIVFDEAGMVDVFCDIHSNMHAVVIVMSPQTYKWQLLKDATSFQFVDLPTGSYRLHVAAKGFRMLEQEVLIEAGETHDLPNLQLTR
jgi:plastocyanin